ncbi:MAG: preprotein translocase subunit SecA [Verrucomicrobiales bacterium]|nr:preprotein translocase subunit SecA [Verrucomicrobiales bacterium]
MVKWLLQKIVGSKHTREINKLWPLVRKINSIEEELQSLTDDQLREKTANWQRELRAMVQKVDDEIDEWKKGKEQALTSGSTGESADSDLHQARRDIEEQARRKKLERMVLVHDEQSAYMDQIMPEAFAVVKNGARRMVGLNYTVCDQPMTWDMVHFDEQLIGGIGLHRGMIAEMATGEGKTLVATLPIYLNALSGRGVHLVTVNDYLARRDSEWTGELLKFLGLSVGCLQNQMPPPERRENYARDITYGTNSEFGFDYLRDNGMANSKEDQVQRGHHYAIIDEVDSVLIDEARTPLIISGPSTISNIHQYDRYKPLISQIVKKQNVLCNSSMEAAKKAFAEDDPDTGGREMVKVKFGQPRNRQLLRFMEDPEKRKIAEKTELGFYQDAQKKALFALKEELYFTVEERSHDADLTEKGRHFLNPDDPEAFVLPDLATSFSEIDADETISDAEKDEKKNDLQNKMDSQGERMHSISQLLKAYCLYEKDVDYVVTDNKVVIVDENTGREMPGRRWSDGLHQAVEAKEGVKLERETQTLATVTIQNYFRLYEKLGGMTGTAETQAAEFSDIYGLDVLPVPTHKPVLRQDHNDHIFKTRREKYNAVIQFIKERHVKGQPVLVGTASVDASETVARLLKREKIPHSVLNAKYHRQEAEIIQRAGQRGSVTVSTNMAGRGTDIKLGEGVADLGGLIVLATDRHESRRIDRQLRGRCARQGDPGESIFYISFEDDLMRNFGAAERMTKMMDKFGLEEGQELQHKWLNRSVQQAQKRVEQRNYQMRKRVLDFDDVMNNQREVVYGMRNEIIESANPRELIYEAIEESIPVRVGMFLDSPDPDEDKDYQGLLGWCNSTFPMGLTEEDAAFDTRGIEESADFIINKVKELYEMKTSHENPDHLDDLERSVLLGGIDRLWQEHLYNMDALREGVHLRAHGQKDPLIEYKTEAFAVFQELMENIKSEVLVNLFRSTTNLDAFNQFLQGLPMNQGGDVPGGVISQTTNSGAMSSPGDPELGDRIKLPVTRAQPKVGRNEPCPCGSGKKFKQCCGRAA